MGLAGLADCRWTRNASIGRSGPSPRGSRRSAPPTACAVVAVAWMAPSWGVESLGPRPHWAGGRVAWRPHEAVVVVHRSNAVLRAAVVVVVEVLAGARPGMLRSGVPSRTRAAADGCCGVAVASLSSSPSPPPRRARDRRRARRTVLDDGHDWGVSLIGSWPRFDPGTVAPSVAPAAWRASRRVDSSSSTASSATAASTWAPGSIAAGS